MGRVQPVVYKGLFFIFKPACTDARHSYFYISQLIKIYLSIHNNLTDSDKNK